MNEKDYCSLLMARRLQEAGIILQTDCMWVFQPLTNKWYLSREGFPTCTVARMEVYSAPTLSEVWRELVKRDYPPHSNGNTFWICADGKILTEAINENPTDACCELLIWLTQQEINQRIKAQEIADKQKERSRKLKETVSELRKTMQCNCDLDNWQPESNTGHSWVCRIHKEAMRLINL